MLKCPLKPFTAEDTDVASSKYPNELITIKQANALLQSRWEDAVKERGIELFSVQNKKGQVVDHWRFDERHCTHKLVGFAEKIEGKDEAAN